VFAATPDVPVLQAVLTLSANTGHPPDTENPADVRLMSDN
jgi:hypothetical protein